MEKIKKENEGNTYWEITWASAAPLMPRWNTNIKIGSKIMLVASPATALP